MLEILILSGLIFGLSREIEEIEVRAYSTALVVATVFCGLSFLFNFFLLGAVPNARRLPWLVLALGLFTAVVNAALVWLTARLVRGFTIHKVLYYFVLGVAISVTNIVVGLIL